MGHNGNMQRETYTLSSNVLIFARLFLFNI